MDYCSSCRRHLNGALVCPGCGAYAPDIDPTAYAGATPASTVTTAGAATGTAPGDFDTWQDGGPGDETDVVAAPIVTEGRAARRRQRARWKKNQRRAVVATAVALVGGSLTMVAMDQQSGDRARAATAPQDPGLDTFEEPTGHDARPATTRPEKPRSTPTPTPPASERSSRQGDAGSARTAPSNSGPETASAPTRATELSAPQPRTTAPSSSDNTGSGDTGVTEGSDTADRSAPAPAPTPPSANDGADSTNSGAEEPTTPPAAQSPEELCLLVLCVGGQG
jgi:hypothetical protein